MSGCNWNLSQVALCIQGQLIGNDCAIDGVGIDTRKLAPGQFFVALKGLNFDAHDFVTEALTAGAVAVMVERQVDIAAPQIVVKNCLQSLGGLAKAWRQHLNIPLVAVTGSNGKTTVKEMLAAIFSQHGDTLATAGNLNNDIGVPLTLLSISETDKAAIIEMGANHPNEIAYLTQLANPTVALITNAASAHLEGFGTLEGVAKAKGEIFQGLLPDGYAVINADDSYASLWRELAGDKRCISFGVENKADVSCQWQNCELGNELTVETPQGNFVVTLQLLGKHNIVNALAATAAALAAGVSPAEIRTGLAAMRPVPRRLQTKQGISGARIIDDTYNANPTSLNAAIQVLVQYGGKRYLALGDMGELGADANEIHQQAGENARQQGVDYLFAFGRYCASAVQAFGENAEHFNDQEKMIKAIQQQLNSDVTLLVKGSRSMQMDKVADALSISSNDSRGWH